MLGDKTALPQRKIGIQCRKSAFILCNNKSIAFIAGIADMSAGINNINIAEITVRTVTFSFGTCINDSLNMLRKFIKIRVKACCLTKQRLIIAIT